MVWLKIMIHAEVNAIRKYDTLFFRSLYKAYLLSAWLELMFVIDNFWKQVDTKKI